MTTVLLMLTLFRGSTLYVRPESIESVYRTNSCYMSLSERVECTHITLRNGKEYNVTNQVEEIVNKIQEKKNVK